MTLSESVPQVIRSASVSLQATSKRGRELTSLENLHIRFVLSVTAQVLRDRDSLIRPVAVHEWEGVGLFLFRDARRAAEGIGVQDLLSSRERANEPLTPVLLRKINNDISNVCFDSSRAHEQSHALCVLQARQGSSIELTYVFLKVIIIFLCFLVLIGGFK
jgi:hypothetical protein